MEDMFIVETSARHIHLSDKDLATLFGEGHQLTNKKDLSQNNYEINLSLRFFLILFECDLKEN